MRLIWIALIGISLVINTAGSARADGVSSTNLLAQVPAASFLMETDNSIQDLEPIEPEPQILLFDLMTVAFETNPSIDAARSNWQAMTEMYPQATSLPDPKLNVNWSPEPIETRNGSIDFAVQLMQMIPAPGHLDGGGAYCGGGLTDIVFQNCVLSNNAASA